MRKRFEGFTILKNKPVKVSLFIKRLENRDIFDKRLEKRLARLNGIYKQIPQTKCTCSHPGDCCSYYVIGSVYSIEYLNILKYIRGKFTPAEISKLAAFAGANLAIQEKYRNKKKPKRWRPCIFLDDEDRTCRIYQARPFVCRIYGLTYETKKDCSKVIILDKKDKELLNPGLVRSLWKEIRGLSDNFIYTFKDSNNILVSKHQDINNWFFT